MATITTSAKQLMESEEEVTSRIRRLLAEAANETPGSGSRVAYHDAPPAKISLPNGMPVAVAAAQLAEEAADQNTVKSFSRSYRFRPWDGAVALSRVLEKYFGTSGRGLAIQTFFGPVPPKMVDVEIGFNKVIQVPWGDIEFSRLEGVLHLGSTGDPDLGLLFKLSIDCPAKYASEATGLFNLVELELNEHSIYKGQAIRQNAEGMPKFIELVEDDSIVYNRSVEASIDQSVWGVIRNADALRTATPPVKVDPKVLLHGPYGTGKSEAGRKTARIAVENGWTFVSYNSGKGSLQDLEATLQTARLLAPAVVFVEDIDIYAKDTGDDKAQSRMLEMFDGISSKGHEVLILMTSNKAAKFSKAMLRAGRINKMIEIGHLDREATERLIRGVNRDTLGDVDFDKVFEAVKGYEPSFIRQTFDDARQAALIRTADTLKASGTYSAKAAQKFLLNTDDFVTAAVVMKPQHDLHEEASDQEKKVTLDSLFENLLTDVVTKQIAFHNGEIGDIDVTPIEFADRV